MEESGLLKRISRKQSAERNLPNEYDLTGLVKELEKYAQKSLEKRAQKRERSGKTSDFGHSDPQLPSFGHSDPQLPSDADPGDASAIPF
jgi:hypothetical protein